jgi:hypothetical protein
MPRPHQFYHYVFTNNWKKFCSYSWSHQLTSIFSSFFTKSLIYDIRNMFSVKDMKCWAYFDSKSHNSFVLMLVYWKYFEFFSSYWGYVEAPFSEGEGIFDGQFDRFFSIKHATEKINLPPNKLEPNPMKNSTLKHETFIIHYPNQHLSRKFN